MEISVVGSGYVGTVLGACFAEKGNRVHLVDNNTQVVELLNNGQVHIFEPGLEELLKSGIDAGNIDITSDLRNAATSSDVIFVAVPSPTDELTGSVNGSFVLSAVEELSHILADSSEEKIIAIKSTVTPDVITSASKCLADKGNPHLHFAYVPEFLAQGAAVNGTRKPDRIVIGAADNFSFDTLRGLHAPFVRQGNPCERTDPASASLIKYGSNAMLALRICFINELANLAETCGANIEDVRKGIGQDSRIGAHFLYPSAGYGGSCFPKDTDALAAYARKNGLDLPVMQSINRSNLHNKSRWVKKVLYELENPKSDKNVTLWGLAFKPGTDDLRESVSIDVTDALASRFATIFAHDPEPKARIKYGERYSQSPFVKVIKDGLYDSVRDSDCLVILTDCDQFKGIDLNRVKGLMRNPLIIDTRNLYSLDHIAGLGIRYVSNGRRTVDC